MATTQVPSGPDVCQLIKEYTHDPYCLELIQFFGWHPNARFSALAILHTVSVKGERRYIEMALRRLVDKGLLRTYSENSVPLYCLTDEEAMRWQALEIARLDWGQWQAVLKGSHAHLWGYLVGRPAATAA